VAHGAGALIVIPVSRLMHEPQHLPTGAAGWIPLIYLTVIGSIVAFVAFMYLIQHWSATRASFISVVIPVLALVLGLVVRGERLDAASLLGSLIVLAAVITGLLPGPRSAARGVA
jgi:drug/metabolite transporter (DMT)-like permease